MIYSSRTIPSFGLLVSLLLLCLLVALPAQAAMVEETLRVPVQATDLRGRSVSQAITVTLWRDDQAPQPQPVALLLHGRVTHPVDRARMGRVRYPAHAQWLAQQGFLVAVPTRVGYGESGGPDVEASGSCSFKQYAPGFEAAARQALAVMAAVRQRREADAHRGVVIGQSFGGATALALAAMDPPGVQAVVNFSGGAGGEPGTRPQQPCSPSALRRVMAHYGARAKVPALWLYAQGDQFFGEQYPREWFEAWREAGGAGEFVMYPALRGDGHALFSRGASLWLGRVAGFLQARGLGQPALAQR